MGLGLGLCCCGGGECNFVLPKDIAWHSGINAEATCFSLRWEPGGVGPWCFAIPDPGGILAAVLLHDSDLTYRRPGTPTVNIELVLTDSDDTVPNAAYPWELLRRIETLTFTSGSDTLVYVYDESEDALVRDDELSTDSLCCINPGSFRIASVFSARVVESAITMRVDMSGFAGSAGCVAMNDLTPYSDPALGSGMVHIADGYYTIGGNAAGLTRALLPPLMTINDEFSVRMVSHTHIRWTSHFTVPYSSFDTWRTDWLSPSSPVLACVFQQRVGPTRKAWFRLDASAGPDMQLPLDPSLFVFDPDPGGLDCTTTGSLDTIDEL